MDENPENGQQGTGGDPTKGAAPASSYVVQQRADADVVGDDHENPPQTVWIDVCTVLVPARSKRRGVLQQAIDDKQIEAGADEQLYRVLDGPSAETIPVKTVTEPATPKLVIG